MPKISSLIRNPADFKLGGESQSELSNNYRMKIVKSKALCRETEEE